VLGAFGGVNSFLPLIYRKIPDLLVCYVNYLEREDGQDTDLGIHRTGWVVEKGERDMYGTVVV